MENDIVSSLGEYLIKNNISIACAESCTAGLFAATLCNVPGISAVFDCGLVTYSCAAKIRELGVKQETLDKYSAESEQIAAEMAEGLAEKTRCDVCVSITGVAGPDDLSPLKPAGLAYIGLRYKGKTSVIVHTKKGADRNDTRYLMMLHMMDAVYERVTNG